MKYHWSECQKCGAPIGLVGRGLQAILPTKLYWHKCTIVVIENTLVGPVWLVDREGVCYLPHRKVVLKAKTDDKWTDENLDALENELYKSATWLSDTGGHIAERYGNIRHAARDAISTLRKR